MKLACDAILGGVFNDLGSGSNVDLCIIKKDGTRMLRNYLTPNKKPATYVFYSILQSSPNALSLIGNKNKFNLCIF